MNIPVAIKAVGQYVKRAEELDKDVTNPDRDIISFWCRQWAIERAIPHLNEAGVMEFIDQLVTIQEQNKAKAGDKTVGKGVCENHAHLVFNRADEDDRAGKGNKMTAKLFYNASSFLDILEQFEELKDDASIINMRKYAKWKANDILQALNEGRVPQIGGGELAPIASAPAASRSFPNVPDTSNSMPQVPTQVIASVAPTPAPTSAYSPTSTAPTQPLSGGSIGATIGTVFNSIGNAFVTAPSSSSSSQKRAPPKGPTDPRVQDAIELSSFAIASMKYGDIVGAKAKLSEALRRLE